MFFKTTFDSTTNHLNLSPMNCLLLDLTVIDLLSIGHMEKIWVQITKNFGMWSRGRGLVSDIGHPRTRGRGSKKGKFWHVDVLYGLPLT